VLTRPRAGRADTSAKRSLTAPGTVLGTPSAGAEQLEQRAPRRGASICFQLGLI